MEMIIKFRAWDTFNQKMIYDPYRFEQKPDYLDNEEPYVYYTDWRELEDGLGRLCYVMQYTGKKDEKGIEIYEGDLVIGETSYELSNDEFEWTKDKPCIVEWHEVAAGFYPFILNSRWRCDLINIEVIGNIYENLTY